MIPLGVLASARVAASGGGPLTLTYRGTSSTLSISGLDIGSASATRTVIVVSTHYGVAGTPTCTINGTSAPADYTTPATFNIIVGIFRLVVPSGTTASITVSSLGGYERLGVWTVDGLCALVDSDVGAVGHTSSVTVDTASDGFVVLGAAGEYGGSATWIGAVERFDHNYGTGADVSTPTGSPMTASASGWNMRTAAASYGPA